MGPVSWISKHHSNLQVPLSQAAHGGVRFVFSVGTCTPGGKDAARKQS